jgi:hypothetical protein
MASADTTITTTGFGAYDVPADVMWPVVSSWPAIWITEANSPAAVKDVVGEGVGAKRTVFMRDGSGEWGEEITAMDAAGMTWSYKLLSALPGPFAPIDHTKFTCTMSVVKQGDGCKVTISATGVPAELSPMIQGMYTAWTLSMAGLASKTIANFFVIEHTFKAGKADEWWGKFAQIMGEPDGMAKMTQAQHDNGFHNHSFMPGIPADSTAHCVWEAAPGKTAADMQAFIDGEFGPAMGCMDNLVLGPVDASQAQLGYAPYFGTKTAAATEPIKGSTIYMVQHHIKPGKGEALFANMGSIMSKPSVQAGMDEKLRAQGFVNHSFFPLKGKTEGLFACCIWEAKEGLGCADVEQMMENHYGVGGFCDNKVFAIDCTKAMVGLPQKFPASAAALKGVAPAAGAEALTKSVA